MTWWLLRPGVQGVAGSGLFAQLYMYVCERGSKCTALFERRLSV